MPMTAPDIRDSVEIDAGPWNDFDGKVFELQRNLMLPAA